MAREDLLSFLTDQAHNDLVKSTFNSKRVSLERAFAPSYAAFIVSDLDEEPSRLHTEIFDVLDWCHFGILVIKSKQVLLLQKIGVMICVAIFKMQVSRKNLELGLCRGRNLRSARRGSSMLEVLMVSAQCSACGKLPCC